MAAAAPGLDRAEDHSDFSAGRHAGELTARFIKGQHESLSLPRPDRARRSCGKASHSSRAAFERNLPDLAMPCQVNIAGGGFDLGQQERIAVHAVHSSAEQRLLGPLLIIQQNLRVAGTELPRALRDLNRSRQP